MPAPVLSVTDPARGGVADKAGEVREPGRAGNGWDVPAGPPWVLFLALATVPAVLDLVPATSALGFPLAAVAAVTSMVVGAHRYRPARPCVWWGMAAALTLFLVDGIARTELHTLGNLTRTRSLIPDAISLPGYALLGLSFVAIVAARTHDTARRMEIVYDGLIAGVALLFYCFALIIGPVLNTSGSSTPLSVRLVLVAYPAMSLFLVVTTVQIAFSARSRTTVSERSLVLAMGCMFFGDTVMMLAEIGKVPHGGDVLGLLYLPYVLALSAAAVMAIHPSMRLLTEPRQEVRDRWSFSRILLVAIAFTTPAASLVLFHDESLHGRVVLVVVDVVLTCLGVLQILEALHATARSEQQLRYLVAHDSLTGLGNRRFLEARLDEALARSRQSERPVTLLFLDLDRFKLINDTLGHAQGDELLVELAQRLAHEVGDATTLARIGGDEFLIVLEGSSSLEPALELAARLRERVGAPFRLSGGEFQLSASIGVAASSSVSLATAETLIRDADTALHQAKEAGRAAVAVFDSSMRAEIETRVDLERDLRRAVCDGRLHLVYQPIVHLGSGAVTSVEALVRWSHPHLGAILPGRFVPLAEETGLIHEIGAWVLDEALRELALARRQSGFADLAAAVNVSAVQLRDASLVDRIASALDRRDLPGSALIVEITESAMMRDPNTAVAVLEALRRLDVRIAVDDFGIEYSSLAYLHRLPVDLLKIDRSFVEGLGAQDGPAESLVSAMVAIAQALSIETIAEGVETALQAERLRELGCCSVQGYLYSRPVRGEQLAGVLNLIARAGSPNWAARRAETSPVGGRPVSG